MTEEETILVKSCVKCHHWDDKNYAVGGMCLLLNIYHDYIPIDACDEWEKKKQEFQEFNIHIHDLKRPEMKVYLWKPFASDYTDGILVIVVENDDEVRKELTRLSKLEWSSEGPFISIWETLSFWSVGGG